MPAKLSIIHRLIFARRPTLRINERQFWKFQLDDFLMDCSEVARDAPAGEGGRGDKWAHAVLLNIPMMALTLIYNLIMS